MSGFSRSWISGRAGRIAAWVTVLLGTVAFERSSTRESDGRPELPRGTHSLDRNADIAGQFRRQRPGREPNVPVLPPVPQKSIGKDTATSLLRHARQPNIEALRSDRTLAYTETVVDLCRKNEGCAKHPLIALPGVDTLPEVAVYVSRTLVSKGMAPSAASVKAVLDDILVLRGDCSRIPVLDGANVVLLCNSQRMTALDKSVTGDSISPERAKELIRSRGEEFLFGSPTLRELIEAGIGPKGSFTFLRPDGSLISGLDVQTRFLDGIKNSPKRSRWFLSGHGESECFYINGGYAAADEKANVSLSAQKLGAALLARYKGEPSRAKEDYDILVLDDCHGTDFFIDRLRQILESAPFEIPLIVVTSSEYGQLCIHRTNKRGISPMMSALLEGTKKEGATFRTMEDVVDDLLITPRLFEANPNVFFPAKKGTTPSKSLYIQISKLDRPDWFSRESEKAWPS